MTVKLRTVNLVPLKSGDYRFKACLRDGLADIISNFHAYSDTRFRHPLNRENRSFTNALRRYTLHVTGVELSLSDLCRLGVLTHQEEVLQDGVSLARCKVNESVEKIDLSAALEAARGLDEGRMRITDHGGDALLKTEILLRRILVEECFLQEPALPPQLKDDLIVYAYDELVNARGGKLPSLAELSERLGVDQELVKDRITWINRAFRRRGIPILRLKRSADPVKSPTSNT